MHSVKKPWWQQATALVTVTTGGMITGFNFVPGAAATMTSPTSVPLHLLALEQAAQPGAAMNARAVGGDSADSATGDALLRSAIVNVAKYYLQIAATRSPAQMEALIWDNTSSNGVDHGPSCAAFASLTLELAAQAVGQQSWVSGGSSYPYPLPAWADVRVDTNPASPAVTSVTADAQAHGRWHPIGDGYRPQPGDWVLFEHHVEVVTRDSGGVLDTIGADSDPGLTVNAHSYSGTLAADGVVGFVDNGHLAAASFDGTSATAPKAAPPTATVKAGATPSAAAAPTAVATPKAAAPTASATGTPSATDNGKAGSGAAPTDGAAVVPGLARPTDVTGTAIAGTGSRAQAAGTGSATQAPKAPTHAGAGAGSGSTAGAAAGSAAVPGIVEQAGVGISAGSSTTPTAGPTIPGAQASSGTAPAASPSATASAAATPSATASPTAAAATPTAPAATPTAASPAPATPTAATPSAAAPSAAAPSATAAPTSHDSSAAAKPEQYRHYAAAAQATPGTRAQQAFISLIAPGSVAAQQRWGVPAAVTIAQAIEESAWGNSSLAAKYHNLFGIKGSGPAGSVALPTSEFYNGQWVTIDGQFRVYHNVAESIADHAELLATSGYYQRAMADRAIPDAFANDLTGVYATDPDYGANLIALMKLYNLYRFDAPAQPAQPHATPAPTPAAAQPTATAQPTTAAQPTPAAQPTTPAEPTTPAQPTASAQPTATQPAPVHPSADPTVAGGHSAGAQATIPGLGSPALAPTAAAAPAASAHAAHPAAQIPGVVAPSGVTADSPAAAPRSAASPASSTSSASSTGGGAAIPGLGTPVATSYQRQPADAATTTARTTTARTTTARTTAARYQPQFTTAFTTAYFATAKGPLGHGEHLYRDVAGQTGVRWELLAACDWMQCKAHPRYSPVHGEKIGAVNSDGTSYATKSAALTQCASDLVELAAAVYGIDLTARRTLSVRALADAFAAFRWGALLVRHGVSAMEFPYAVAGLTAQHQKMHWPVIDDPAAPDRPGARFREPFGAVPVVLSLDYPATVLADRKRR